MRRRQHMIGGDQRGATVKLAIVHQTRHPRILIDAGRTAANNADLLIR